MVLPRNRGCRKKERQLNLILGSGLLGEWHFRAARGVGLPVKCHVTVGPSRTGFVVCTISDGSYARRGKAHHAPGFRTRKKAVVAVIAPRVSASMSFWASQMSPWLPR
jgi:hypothetical protein